MSTNSSDFNFRIIKGKLTDALNHLSIASKPQVAFDSSFVKMQTEAYNLCTDESQNALTLIQEIYDIIDELE